MVAVEEFIVAVHVTRHRCDQVQYSVTNATAATADASTTAAACSSAGIVGQATTPASDYSKEFGSVQRQCAPQTGRTSGQTSIQPSPSPAASSAGTTPPASTLSSTAATATASYNGGHRDHIGHKIVALSDRPVSGPDQGH